MAHRILNSPLLARLFTIDLGIALVVLIRDLAVIDKEGLWFLRGCFDLFRLVMGLSLVHFVLR
jgi:hypothetical protein